MKVRVHCNDDSGTLPGLLEYRNIGCRGQFQLSYVDRFSPPLTEKLRC